MEHNERRRRVLAGAAALGERLVRVKLRDGVRPAERATVGIAFDVEALHVFDGRTGARL